jgi:hypothetical protein
MKQQRKALSAKNIPRGLGLLFPWMVFITLRVEHAPGWAWGAAVAVCSLYTITRIIDYFTAVDVELP